MKKLVSILLVLVMALSFTGCGKKDKTPTTAQTVHIWHTYTEGQKETLESIVAAFNKEYEGKITVVCEDRSCLKPRLRLFGPLSIRLHR